CRPSYLMWDHPRTRAAGTPMDLLERLITIFAENGYAAVWIALTICGLGLPLPEDVTLVAGGVIAGLGYATVFLLGRRYGEAMLKWRWIARALPPERFEVVQHKFARYGNRVLFVARFLPGM